VTQGMIGDDHPVRRAAQRFVLVVGAGALGAAVCSTGVRYAGPEDDEALRLRNAPTPAAREIGPAETEALTLLRRAAAAQSVTSYEGRKLFGSWSTVGSESVLAEVGHEPGRGTWLRVTSAGARGDADREQIADGAGDLDEQALALLTDQYTLKVGERRRCIGRPATVVEATPIGGRQVAGRFWIDDDSGLLLRRELYDATGRTVRSSSFLDLDVTAPATGPRRGLPASYNNGVKVPRQRSAEREADASLLGEATLDRMRREGWVLPEVLPAGMVLYRARAVDVPGDEKAVHLTYSDGLFSASLFAQRGRLDTSALRGFRPDKVGNVAVHSRNGLYRQLVWAGGDTVYTLVSDAPDTELKQVIGALPHDTPGSGLRARVGRGIDRMGSWINPFA